MRSRGWRVAGLVVVASWLIGCRGDGALQEAGPQMAGAPLAIDADARVRIGEVEGDTLQQLFRVVTPFVMADGRVVVPIYAANTIRVFSAMGVFEASLGRRGSGPGEFQHLLFAWARGDTIEALDFQLRRITRFLPDGATEDITLTTGMPDISGVAGPLGDGWAVGGVARGGYGGPRDVVEVRRFSRTGMDLGEIASVEGMARYVVPDVGGGPEPLSPRAVLAVRNDRVYVAETRTPRIRVFGADGALEREIQWLPEPPVAEAGPLHAIVIDSAVARAGAERAGYTRRRLEGAPQPGPLSVFWDLRVDDDGFLWIRPYDPLRHSFALGARTGPGGTWTILTPDGTPAGSVALPPALEPFHITSDAVVGLARNELDVESVRVYALRRR